MNQLASIDARGHQTSTRIPFALSASWPGMLADLSVDINGLRIVAMPTASVPAIRTDGSWTVLSGKTGANDPFALFLSGGTACQILKAADAQIQFDKLLGADATLIVEHLFSEGLAAIESTLGLELTIDRLGDVLEVPTSELLGITIEFQGESHEAALFVGGGLRERLEYFAAERFDPVERDLDPILEVHLGPVVLPAARALLAKPGETIDCGVSPSDTIRGVLMRQDGFYWPITIEDESIEITGELSGPVQSNANSEYVFATFVLATVKLGPVERRHLVAGARVAVDRLPDNHVSLHYQTSPYGTGSLTVLGGNLSVVISEIGPANA